MLLEFLCRCGYTNRWRIHPTRISEFICRGCFSHIGYSNAKAVKFYNNVDLYNSKYRIIYEARSNLHWTNSTTDSTISYDTTTATTNAGYLYSEV